MIESKPAGRVETGMVTVPLASVPVPTTAEPFRTRTVPVGVPEFEVTRTMKLPACPYVVGLDEEVKPVLVGVFGPLLFKNTARAALDLFSFGFSTTKSGSPSPFRSATPTHRDQEYFDRLVESFRRHCLAARRESHRRRQKLCRVQRLRSDH